MRQPGRLIGTVLTLAFCIAGSRSARADAATPAPCPISYSRLQMPLRHAGGASTPMVELSFTNETKKKILRAKFGLIIMDSDGVQSPYSQGLTFSSGADPGKVVNSEWALDLEKIDINHLGETVYLKSVHFEDNTDWVDDGKQRCRQEIYFGPK
jgi:hypothetical protein